MVKKTALPKSKSFLFINSLFFILLFSLNSVNTNALNLISSSAPSSAILGNSYQVKCDYGAVLPCVLAKSGGIDCSYIGYSGTTAMYNCKANALGTQDNYCTLFDYSKNSKCKAQQDKITSTNVSDDPYALMNAMYMSHINYFLSKDAVTSYGIPLTAYKVGERARFGYSNPTEWGYLLQAYISASDRGVMSRNEAIRRINISLNTMASLQNDPNQNYKKLFYPYYQVTKTYSPGDDVFPYHTSSNDIPSIDNGLLYSSLLITEGWARDIGNTEIANKAKSIKDKMNFSIFLYDSGSNKYLAHTINANTNALSSSKWDVYADEGGLMTFIAYSSNSISFDDYKKLINSQMRNPVSWNGHTVNEGAWFNVMFTWATRSIAGYKVVGTPYSKNSFVPTIQAHQDYGTLKGVDYPGFSNAMSQGLVNYYVPPNLANTVPASAPSSITPHAFFIPYGVYEDLDKTSNDNLIKYIQKLKTDSAGYYFDSGQYPYGFVVAASAYANQVGYSGVNPSDGKLIFETLSESYTVLSLNDYLQRHDGKKDFYSYATNVPGYSSKYADSINFLYP